MRDGVDFMLAENVIQERHIAKITDNEFRWVLHSGTKAGRQIIENDNLFAGVEKCQHHMAADIARTSSYQNRHAVTPEWNLLHEPKP
jgi:hypothetical protein